MDIGFYILGFLTCCSSLLAISAKNLTRAVICLGLFFLSIGLLYINLGCEFLGFIQILVYVGGVIILFLFVIMTSGYTEHSKSRLSLKIFGALSSILLLFLLIFLFLKQKPQAFKNNGASGINEIGRLIMTEYLIQFEVISLLLLVVLIGAIFLLKKD